MGAAANNEIADRQASTIRLTCHQREAEANFDLDSSFIVASGWSACWAGCMAMADSLSFRFGTNSF
jgi:hypothetical protein